ncbi:MAG: helix-turn-helix domain-containing protein, partial [Thiohalocapsa sp.]
DDARDALLPAPSAQPGQDPVLVQDIRQGIDLNGIIDQVARHYLEQAMQHTAGNKSRAAKLLGFGNPTTLTNWLRKHSVGPWHNAGPPEPSNNPTTLCPAAGTRPWRH